MMHSPTHSTSRETFHDTLSPIVRLPFEILEQIFLELVAPYQRTPSNDDFSLADDRNERVPKAIAQLMAVCRSWREVALQCPRLWAHLPMSLSEDTISRFLALSKTSPLSIYSGRYEYSLILQQRHRLQHLYDIEIQGGLINEYLASAGLLDQTIDFPLLESLQVRFDSRGGGYLWHAYAPKLKRLTLWWSSFDAVKRWSARAEQLTLLSVGRMAPQGMVTIGDWLSLLSRLPSLEYLYFFDCLIHDSDATVRQSQAPARHVFLPRLRKLSFKSLYTGPIIPHGREGFASLVLHLALPWKTQIYFDKTRVTWRLTPADGFLLDLGAVLYCLNSRRSAVIGSESSERSLYRREYHTATLTYPYAEHWDSTHVVLSLSDAHSADALLTVTLPAFNRTLYHVHNDLLPKLLGSPLLSGVTTLRLHDVVLTAMAWAVLAVVHPQIAEVHITHMLSLVSLVRALESSLNEEPVRLPGLRRLSFAPLLCNEDTPVLGVVGESGSSRKKMLYERLASVLAVRKGRGLHDVEVDTGAETFAGR